MKKKVIEDNPKKERKVTSGPIRDKERTKARMIAAVGKVIQKKGYHALNGPNIALECGLNKALIWNYFGGLDQLVEAYLTQKDFWQGRIGTNDHKPGLHQYLLDRRIA